MYKGHTGRWRSDIHTYIAYITCIHTYIAKRPLAKLERLYCVVFPFFGQLITYERALDGSGPVI